MKVRVCPHVDPYYSGFYLYGLEKLFGKKNIFYTMRGFEDILPCLWYNVYMAFIIEDENGITKYVVDSNDYNTVKKDVYDWCDVYGHCNANFSTYSQSDYPKLVVLCPSFGVRCWNIVETIHHCVSNLFKLHFRVPSIKKYIWRYYKQYKRRPYTEYTTKMEHTQYRYYLYCCNTLWYNTGSLNNDTGLNYIRTQYIDACRETPNVIFEGGLVPAWRSRKQASKFKDYLTSGVSAKVYLDKTKQSMVVFNTPAFWDCHGWKLGEYMALGKCIISTPLLNELPTPKECVGIDDKSWISKYFCIIDKNKQSMKNAIEYIKMHPEYKDELEERMTKYWQENGSPLASLKRLGIK